MLSRNPCMANINASYLFPEVTKRRRAFEERSPSRGYEDRIISLGIGNTTEPVLPHIDAALVSASRGLGTPEGYSGYGDDYGNEKLREKIAKVFYHDRVTREDVFISDGSKPDIGRLQLMFGSGVRVAVQDPSYPVYVDGSALIGASGTWQEGGYRNIVYLPCTAENNYFPDLQAIPENALVYFCNPNNPTGAVAGKDQLRSLVEICRSRGCIIIYDAAYAEFIREKDLPKSIYEIDGAKEAAIEVNSFSKPAGFTGVRLGWTVVPREIKYADGMSVNKDWQRICSTIFNGASNIAQAGGLATLDEEGLKEVRQLTDYYLENALRIRKTVGDLGIPCVGGDNSPYIWAHFPGKDSWEVFSAILEQCRVVTTPGSGFGPSGESFIRFSGFGHHADIEEGCRRLGRLKI